MILLSLSSQVTANMPEEGTPCTQIADMEDLGAPKPPQPGVPVSVKRKRISTGKESQQQSQSLELTQSWMEILGPPPPMGTTKVMPLHPAGLVLVIPAENLDFFLNCCQLQ